MDYKDVADRQQSPNLSRLRWNLTGSVRGFPGPLRPIQLVLESLLSPMEHQHTRRTSFRVIR
jgi:hypothetical protein